MKNSLNSTHHGADNINLSSQLINSFCEKNILYLQNLFLTKGVHVLDAEQIESGRQVIKSILDSSNYYQNVACLGHSKLFNTSINLDPLFNDIKNEPDRLMSFFLEDFHYDLLWIEESRLLLDVDCYRMFKQYIFDFKIDKSSTIVIFESCQR